MTKPLLLLALLAPTLASAAIELPVKECAGRLEFSVPAQIELPLAGDYNLTNGDYPKWDVAMFENYRVTYWANMKYGDFELFTTDPFKADKALAIRQKYIDKSKAQHEYYYRNRTTPATMQFGKLVKWFGEGKTKAFGRSAPSSIEFILYDKNFYYFF